ncbi:hypothetical protein GBA52_014560 [Prunus armeniaca]|nr:hypothetical protein GBA52_014560 [Prunus armeniaca]
MQATLSSCSQGNVAGKNEGAADGNPNFPMEIIGDGLPVSQNLSIYGFPKVGRAGMYRESLASPVTLTLLTENIKHETTVDRRGKEGNGGLSFTASVVVFITCTLVSGKYGFTIGNELQDSRKSMYQKNKTNEFQMIPCI